MRQIHIQQELVMLVVFNGVAGTGGGGGGSADLNQEFLVGANGGSGVCVIRYQIGGPSGTAKATGGMISYKDGKVIHQFLSSENLLLPTQH